MQMTIEAILHRDWYLQHDNLSVNLAALNTKYKLSEQYALLSGSAAMDFQKAYDLETMWCFTLYEYCSLWQMHQCASVIGRLIVSVFPEFEDIEDKAPLCYFHNRILYP